MDDPKARLQAALKEAMANKDAARRDTLRLLMSALKQVEVDERKELSADDVYAILQKEAKKRRESIDEMEKAGRAALAANEQRELNLIEEFLPRQLTREEVAALARDAIAQSGATSPKDMGKVMGVLMPKVKGLADGKLVNDVVRELLSS
ncbi:MAG: GatB/YqeY domain-containing protein [Chloroflexi bacterium]|nr:GatB/YqeY domain-containing protein [Chloroflexota bacterium]